jgi:hypothetical protein
MTLQSLNRWTASGLHLVLSAVLALIVVTLVLVLWYPRPYFAAMGGETLLRLLIGVDVVIGPLITLIIYDRTKPRLKWDLAVIAVLQVAAIVYGGVVMFEARPVYNVFVVDRFEMVAANSIDDDSLAKASPAYASLPLTGPRLAAARKPEDPKEQMRITLDAMNGGPDIASLPHLYVPYSDVAASVARGAKPLSMLSRRSPDAANKVARFLADSGRVEESVGFVPIRARNEDLAGVVDRKTGEVVGYLTIRPW